MKPDSSTDTPKLRLTHSAAGHVDAESDCAYDSDTENHLESFGYESFTQRRMMRRRLLTSHMDRMRLSLESQDQPFLEELNCVRKQLQTSPDRLVVTLKKLISDSKIRATGMIIAPRNL